MSQDLAGLAKKNGIRYFMIRSPTCSVPSVPKLVPAAAIAEMQKDAPASRASPPGWT